MKATDFPQLSEDAVNPPAAVIGKDAPSSSVRVHQHAVLPLPDAATVGYEKQPSHPPRLSREEKKALKEKIEDVLDLHQKTVPQAHAALQDFLDNCLTRDVRVVEIVHGRGMHSENHIAVLRGKVRCWLARCPQVRCYKTAADEGALLALLVHAKRIEK